jgi:mono/diheme cytochrome c family protein
MKIKMISLIGCFMTSIVLFGFLKPEIENQKTVSEVLTSLGEPTSQHASKKSNDQELIQKGADLIHKGVAIGPNGKKSSKQSKHFACRSCHNVEREDPVLNDPKPEYRLKFAIKNDLPFLQGTTLWGIVNREHWYNGDYFKKYGNLVDPARDTLVNAVQLCAIQCSQGRAYEDWEMDAVMAYLWSLELKMSDLDLKSEEIQKINEAIEGSDEQKTEAIALIKSKYLLASPATFKYPWKGMPINKGKGGNVKNGSEIYKRSCMHCHQQGGVTNFTLDISKLDMKLLANNVKKNNDYSIYWITRLGTHPIPGYKPYMPHYPVERLSDAQIEDLVAYVMSQK